ncbi:hypothetical protein MMB17_14825 [Methylobacterium organophilum]|uniref:hypothetical protein n=1 Tax=Methylobacterium organophilum TaxID=410 RepID=UPI001F13C908|nr:hypothetical protein [Methylobacterium organophilum]UMY16000.1 hypothetical protein MMB17_14825 [Methylobacterium organophilum]
MGTIGLWGLFAVFGAICGWYVSVVGFILTGLLVILAIGAVNFLLSGPLTALMLVGAFVALQVGYFVSVILNALVGHFTRLSTKDPRQVEGDLHMKHD